MQNNENRNITPQHHKANVNKRREINLRVYDENHEPKRRLHYHLSETKTIELN